MKEKPLKTAPKSNWMFKGKILNEIPELVTHFVYKITEIKTGKFYIGYKSFYSTRKKKLAKKDLSADKRKKTYKMEIAESDWREYNSSSKPLQALIKAHPDKFNKEILLLCFNIKQARYYELKLQCVYEVLETDSFNGNILGKFFACDAVKPIS